MPVSGRVTQTRQVLALWLLLLALHVCSTNVRRPAAPAHAYQAAHAEGAAHLPLKSADGARRCHAAGPAHGDLDLRLLQPQQQRQGAPRPRRCPRTPHGQLLHGSIGRCHAVMQLHAALHDMHKLLSMLCAFPHGRGLGRRAALLLAKRGSGRFSTFPAHPTVSSGAAGQEASDSPRLHPQACPELVQEAVEYIEPVSCTGLEAPPAPAVLVAVDATLDGPELGALQAALLEARASVCLQAHPWHEVSCRARAGRCACRCQPTRCSADPPVCRRCAASGELIRAVSLHTCRPCAAVHTRWS